MRKNMTIVANICLSNIPKDKLKKGKDGKFYTTLILRPLKQVDDYENDMYVAVNQTKEEREVKTDLIFVGRARTFEYTERESVENMESLSEVDESPF